jgi:hypothetical protein
VLVEYAATLGLIDIEYVPPTGAHDDYQHNRGGDYLDQLSRYDGLAELRLKLPRRRHHRRLHPSLATGLGHADRQGHRPGEL